MILTLAGAASLSGIAAPPAHAFAVQNGTVIGKHGWLFLLWEDPRYADFATISKTAHLINQAVEILKTAEIDVAIALIPAKSRVYDEFLPDDLGFSTQGQRRYAFAREEIAKSGIVVPDLASVLTALRRKDGANHLYFKADTHWTAAGAECAAQEFGRQITKAIKLPLSPRPGMSLGPATTRLRARNDLAETLAAPAGYPLESYLVRLPLAAQHGEGLIEDDAADLTVVGSSYMAPEHNFVPMLSSQLNRPVGLLWRRYDAGPYQTMLTYLKSQAFRRNRPKLIVWNFHETGMTAGPDLAVAWTDHAMGREVFLEEMRKASG